MALHLEEGPSHGLSQVQLGVGKLPTLRSGNQENISVVSAPYELSCKPLTAKGQGNTRGRCRMRDHPRMHQPVVASQRIHIRLE